MSSLGTGHSLVWSPIVPGALMLRRLAQLRSIFIGGETNTIRVILAIASLIFAAVLWYPSDDLFDTRQAWASMRAVAPGWVWGVIFFLHFVGVFWRQLDARPRPYVAFAINAYGLFIWFVMTGMTTQQIGQFSPANSLELTVLLAAFVALVRTGLNDEKISP